mmetsp:Transcript_104810/g.313113  ORF Transcript_104810/g.313113 Transcript_104810/m.313113 type:complete len:378 (-) Transcript_104810:63-1196(-)
MSVPSLPARCFLPHKELEELIGLRYKTETFDHADHLSNFCIEGSEHYILVEAGPPRGVASFILRQMADCSQQFILVISQTKYQENECTSVRVEPWEGLEALEAREEADRQRSAAETATAQAAVAAEKAAANAAKPAGVELFAKMGEESYRKNTWVRLFAPEPRVVLTMSVAEPDDQGIRLLTFTSMDGTEVYMQEVELDQDLAGLWAALTVAAKAPSYSLAVVLPGGGMINGPLRGPVRLEQLLAGVGASDGCLEATLTGRASFCVVEESGDLPLDSIAWTRKDAVEAGSSLETALQAHADRWGRCVWGQEAQRKAIAEACAAVLRGSSIRVEAACESENVPSKRCWWIDSNFWALAFGGEHKGTILIMHEVNKDMS